MEIRVSFLINDRVITANKKIKEAVAKLNEDYAIRGHKIVDPLFEGWQYLDSEKDSGYIQMLMNADVVDVNGGEFRVLKRTLKASSPQGLWIEVEPFDSNTKLNYVNNFQVEVEK